MCFSLKKNKETRKKNKEKSSFIFVSQNLVYKIFASYFFSFFPIIDLDFNTIFLDEDLKSKFIYLFNFIFYLHGILSSAHNKVMS